MPHADPILVHHTPAVMPPLIAYGLDPRQEGRGEELCTRRRRHRTAAAGGLLSPVLQAPPPQGHEPDQCSLRRLCSACEHAKRTLLSSTQAHIQIDSLFDWTMLCRWCTRCECTRSKASGSCIRKEPNEATSRPLHSSVDVTPLSLGIGRQRKS